MSIINSFDKNSKEIILPKDCYEKRTLNVKTILITFSKKIIDNLKEKDLLILVDSIHVSGTNGEHLFYLMRNTNIGIYMTIVGAPMTVGLLEEFSYIFNSKNIVIFGSCGVLDRNITAGKIIVPTHAFRDEGTSYHYMEASDYVEIKNYNKVCEILSQRNIDFITGKTWTTDAFYRETKDNLEKRKNDGCLTVEMEVSAIQAMCNFRGLNLYNFLYGADNLDTRKWDKRILGKHELDTSMKCFYIALDIAKVVNNL